MKITYIRSFSRDETCTHIPHDDVFSCCNCTDLSLFTDWTRRRRQCDFHGLGSPRILWACSRLWPFTSSLLNVCVICEKPREKTMSSHISRILHLYNHGGGETLISKQSIKYFAPFWSYHQHYILPFLYIICMYTLVMESR